MSSIFSVIRDFGIIDSVALGIMIFFVVRGFRQGASGEIGSVLAWLITAAFFFFGFSFVSQEVMSLAVLQKNASAAQSIAFILTLSISIGIFFVSRKLLTDSIGMTIPTPFNEILGTFFGALKSVLLIAFLCACGTFNPGKGDSHAYLRDSSTVKLLHPIISKVTQR